MMLENTRLLQLRPGSLSDGDVEELTPTSVDKPERAFHILYYLLAKGHSALDAELVQELYPDTMRMDGDASGYDRVNEAMQTVAGGDEKIPEISWDAMAAVALLMAAKNYADPRVERAYKILGNLNFNTDTKSSVPEAMVQDGVHQDVLDRAELHARSKALYLCIFDVSESFLDGGYHAADAQNLQYWTSKLDRQGNDSVERRSVFIYDIVRN